MKLLRIELKNFKPFRDLSIPQDDGELPDGLIIVKGENSTGKSSLFEGILWALWGSDAVAPTNDELVRFASSFCKVILTFDVDGTQYKIDRSYDQATGIDVVLFQKLKGDWKRIADKSKSVATKLEEIFNLGLKQALSTLLVRQGEVALIANATPSVLRDLLIRVYNIELMGQMTGHLDSLESELSSKINALRDDYYPPEVIQQQIDEATQQIGEYEADLKEKEKKRTKVQETLESLPDSKTLKLLYDLNNDHEKRIRNLEQSSLDRDSDLDYAGLLSADKAVIKARLDLLMKESEKLESQVKSNKTEIKGVDRETGHLSGVSSDLIEKVSELEEIEGDKTIECPTCSKPLTLEQREKLVLEYRTTIQENSTRLTELKSKRDALTDVSRDFESKMVGISSAIEAIRRIMTKQKTVDTAQKDLDKTEAKMKAALAKIGVEDIESFLAKHAAKSINDLQNKQVESKAQLDSLTREYKLVEKEIEKQQKRISDGQERAVYMKELAAEIDSLTRLSEHAKYVRLKLINGFVADYVVQKRLIGIIRGATNPYVQAFTRDQYSSVDLVPTLAKGRSGAGLVLKIRDERDNATKKTSQLSYGDRTAISLALRLGISRTMSAIRPTKDSPAISPRVRCVLLDEPLGGLDKNRRISVVRNLVNDASFKQIFLITHTDIQDWDEVPVIDVTKSGSASDASLIM
ncbi:MAG: AAA family ATPase [Candidatus Thorarchaeota archaeon]